MYQQPAKDIYFINLDALRFLSFLGVFLAHTLRLPEASYEVVSLLEVFFTFNYLGVPCFFTLSSFLITYRLLSEKDKNGNIRLLKFYKNRSLRIWPAYYLLVIFCFFLLPPFLSTFKIAGPTLPPLLPFAFFYVNFYMIEYGSAFTFALSILWSISIEEQFYLVWGFSLKIISVQFLSKLIVLISIFSIGFSYYFLHVQHGAPNSLAIHSFYVLQNFCAGAAIALICLQKNKVYYFLEKLPSVYISAVYIILPIAGFLLKDMVMHNIFKSICYSIIIYDQAFNEQRLFNLGKSAIVNYFGKISYGLYLYHAIIFVVFQKQFDFFVYAAPVVWPNLKHVMITFIVTGIIAHISYRYLESRFLMFKTR